MYGASGHGHTTTILPPTLGQRGQGHQNFEKLKYGKIK